MPLALPLGLIGKKPGVTEIMFSKKVSMPMPLNRLKILKVTPISFSV